jgi:hypothetical protein
MIIQIQFAKPSIRQMEPHFLGQSAFRADAVAVADDEHSDHEFGVDRRTPDLAIVRFEFLGQTLKRHRHEHVDPAQKVVLGNAIFQPKFVEQSALIAPLPPHHRTDGV